MGKTIPEQSVEARWLYDRLIQLAPDEQITYEELSGVIGQDIRNPRMRGRLRTAVKRALNDDGIRVATIHTVGVKRLTDHDNIWGTGAVFRKRVHRGSMKAAREVGCADLMKASPEDKSRAFAELSYFGALSNATKERYTDKIQQVINQSGIGQPLPLAKTIELFKD